MTEAQMRADMEVLMARLVLTERALVDTRQQVAAVPKVTAPLADTRTIGKTPTFTGTQGLAGVVISIHSVHGIRESQVD